MAGCCAQVHLCWGALMTLLTCFLMPRLSSHCTVPGCQLKRSGGNGFLGAGDILIGGIFPLHDARVYSAITFTEKPPSITCKIFALEYYQWLQAMLFTIQDVNQNADLLPNVTLGFRIFNSCRVLERVLEGTMWILTGQEESIPNYQFLSKPPTAAIIGDSTSTGSILMARILGLYRYPQISHSSSSPILSDRIQFPSFFRTIPNDDFQFRGLAQLIKYFSWTWVGILAEDMDYGQQGARILKQELSKAGACVAFSESIRTSQADMNAHHIVQVIKRSTANAIVAIAIDYEMVPVLNVLLSQNVSGKVWISTEAWSTSVILSFKKYSKILLGTIGFNIHSGEMIGFWDYLSSANPVNFPDYIYIREFWEEAFRCKWLDSKTSVNLLDNVSQPCPGNETLDSLLGYHSKAIGFWFTYSIYRAVYAIALALHGLIDDRSNPINPGATMDILNFRPWELLHYMKNVHFPGKYGNEQFFDSFGNPPAQYDIINWQLDEQGTIAHVRVGKYDSSTPPGRNLEVNASAIVWSEGSTKVPLSICSPTCSPGFRKAAREHDPLCCFQCVPCARGEISNETDLSMCCACPWDQWPNEKQDKCIPKTIEILSYEDPLGATLAATSIISSLVPVAILLLFTRHRNTPIVRANNCNLSYLLLLSLSLCFLCSLAFIGYPTQEKCLLRQVAFGISFTFCVACILAKTMTVVLAFNATKPNSLLQTCIGPQLSYTVVGGSTLIQIVLCISWLTIAPPFTEYNIHTKPGKIIVQCNEGSPLAFWGVLGYLGLLASISFTFAVPARKLPNAFNEAKSITFSMLTFLSVWLSFIIANLTTRGKSMVAMEIFAILSSSFSLVSLIFFPKCYIILLKPEMNCKENRIGKASIQRKKI